MQKARVPNPTDKWDYDKVVSHEPSGVLAFEIYSSSWDTRGMRTRWNDTKSKKLENLLPECVAGMMRIAAVLRQKEDERKREELARQKRARELAQLRKDIEEEERKVEQFKNWLEHWESAESMRRFITVYAEKMHSRPAESQMKCREWIEWAKRQADRVDPFTVEKPESVLDRKHELRCQP